MEGFRYNRVNFTPITCWHVSNSVDWKASGCSCAADAHKSHGERAVTEELVLFRLARQYQDPASQAITRADSTTAQLTLAFWAGDDPVTKLSGLWLMLLKATRVPWWRLVGNGLNHVTKTHTHTTPSTHIHFTVAWAMVMVVQASTCMAQYGK